MSNRTSLSLPSKYSVKALQISVLPTPGGPSKRKFAFGFPLRVNPQFTIDQNRNHLSNHCLAEDFPVHEGLETFQFFPQLWINHRLPDQAVTHLVSTV